MRRRSQYPSAPTSREGKGICLPRRTFIALAGAAAAASPFAARAQEPARIYRLGDLHLSPRHTPWNDAMFNAVKADGFIEGQNLIVDDAGFGLQVDQLAEHASAVVKAKVDLITAAGDPAVRVLYNATKSIPVLAVSEDLVGSGFVASLAEPKGNITGVSILSTELNLKRQEILLEAYPGTRRLAILADADSISAQQLQALQDAAQAHGVASFVHRISKADEIAGAIDAAKNSGVTALNVLASALLYANRQAILSHLAALRLPAIFQWPDTAEEGALLSYGPSILQIFRDILSRQLVKLLRGVPAADIPVEQPTKFQLAVNLKVAKALDLNIPETLLLRADNVIE
jgi:putative tryptophan/tyrosine transport system substrate-binding protein